MKRIATCLGVALALGLAAAGRADETNRPEVVDLWPSTPPGEAGKVREDAAKTNDRGEVVSVNYVAKPTLTIRRPDPAKNTGVAVVVCPGGGYNMLAWEHEGAMVADWLNSIGVTAAILKYRIPRRDGTPRDTPPPQALMDAQRAVGLVRSKASGLGVDPKKVGLLGFSAGGHLTAWAGTNHEKRTYEPVDDADKLPCRPDFLVAIYPGGVVKRGTAELTPDIKIDAQTPPTFLAHAGNDPVSVENSLAIYAALKKAGVPAELHVYSTGGHGFGMRRTGNPCSDWPERCEEWMRAEKILPARSSK